MRRCQSTAAVGRLWASTDNREGDSAFNVAYELCTRRKGEPQHLEPEQQLINGEATNGY